MINYVRRATLLSDTAASNTLCDAQAEDIKMCDLKKPLNEGNKQLKLAKKTGHKGGKMTCTISLHSKTIKVIEEDAACSQMCPTLDGLEKAEKGCEDTCVLCWDAR